MADAAILSSKGVRPQVSRDRDNGELKYTLRSIAKNAPWVDRIFLLVNGQVRLPEWVPEPQKTIMIDRCSELPLSHDPWLCSIFLVALEPKLASIHVRALLTGMHNTHDATSKPHSPDPLTGVGCSPRAPAQLGMRMQCRVWCIAFLVSHSTLT